jgi:hypothetical protein
VQRAPSALRGTVGTIPPDMEQGPEETHGVSTRIHLSKRPHLFSSVTERVRAEADFTKQSFRAREFADVWKRPRRGDVSRPYSPFPDSRTMAPAGARLIEVSAALVLGQTIVVDGGLIL